MYEDIKGEIAQFQENMKTIRKVAGWTVQELGDRIGVSKQTISNLENQVTEMTKTQYIATRAILDLEIATNQEKGPAIKAVMQALLTDDEELNQDDADDLLPVEEKPEAHEEVDKQEIVPVIVTVPNGGTAKSKKNNTGTGVAAAGLAIGAAVVPWLIRMSKGKR